MSDEKFTFFWSGPFSQWDYSPFEIDGITFPNAETYMMWAKDQLFSGGKLESQILAAKNPKTVKALGRLVQGFNRPQWEAVAKTIVFRGNMAKFTQNKSHYKELIRTKGTTLVEASPFDCVWGIGLAESDPRCNDRNLWMGTNWLGEVLTDVRDTLINCANLQYSLVKIPT